MRKWVMGLGVAFFAVSAMSSASLAAGKKPYTSTTITEGGVRSVCGGDLQSGGGAIGCTKGCGKATCDYSCGGPEGKGCRTIVFTRTAPTGTGAKLTLGQPLTIKPKSSDSLKPKTTTTTTSVTAGPPKAGLVSDSNSASMKTGSSKNKSSTDKTITTTPVTTGGTR